MGDRRGEGTGDSGDARWKAAKLDMDQSTGWGVGVRGLGLGGWGVGLGTWASQSSGT